MTDPYLSPTGSCLANKLGVDDPDKLQVAEARLVSIRDVQLSRDPLPGYYNLDHLQRVHAFLFQDVYEWAGQTRRVNIAKPGSFFAPWWNIEELVSALAAQLKAEDYLIGRSKDAFVARLAYYYSELNAYHPFREGNGRTQRALLRQLGVAAGWRIDWSELSEDANIEASRESFSNPDSSVLVELLHPLVFKV